MRSQILRETRRPKERVHKFVRYLMVHNVKTTTTTNFKFNIYYIRMWNIYNDACKLQDRSLQLARPLSILAVAAIKA